MDEEAHMGIMIRERVVGNTERHEGPEEPKLSEHSDGEHHEEGDESREEHDTEVVDDSHLGEVAEQELETEEDDEDVSDDEITVASVFGSDVDSVQAGDVLEEDPTATHDEGTSTSLSGDASVEGHEETEDAQPFQRLTGKRTHREETPSEEMRVRL
ncbi:hypothetical protein PC110_g5154 [Phytophthora cactorum]|uniref:Uncharacterized protein n=1 Tax=Phytophthora cactorum TaxID=29920 RepID=A0A329SPI8_9STRA|nr:hypothetical protein PC110_g5154 [Phytophthora cactorum]